MTSPTIVLSITQFEKQSNKQEQDCANNNHQRSNINKDEPVLCFVYLGDKIQDVRGVSREETRIKLINTGEKSLASNISPVNNEVLQKSILIQIKQGSANTLGFVKLPIALILSDNSLHLKTWVPLHKSKETSTIQFGDLQSNLPDTSIRSFIYLDIKLQEEYPLKQRSPYRNPFKIDDPNSQFQSSQQSPIQKNVNQTYQQFNPSDMSYQEISDNITLIHGQPFQESQKIVAQSLGQQIFKKKKKNTYTQSAAPQIQLLSANNSVNNSSKPLQQSIIPPQELEKTLINEELLQQLPSNIDKTQVKQDLTQIIDEQVASIQNLTFDNYQKLTNWYELTKQISYKDKKDLIVNDQRQSSLNNLQRDVQLLLQNRKETENQQQQLATQIKLLEMHGGDQFKKHKLSDLQEQVAQLKQDLENLQNNPNQAIHTFSQGSTTSTSLNLEDTEINNQLQSTQIQSTTLQVLERQNIEINSLQKQIQAEQQSFENYEKKFEILIKKQSQQKSKSSEDLEEVQTIFQSKSQELTALKQQITLEKEKNQLLISQTQEDPDCSSESQEVKNQKDLINHLLNDLKQALEENKTSLISLKEIEQDLSASVSEEFQQSIIESGNKEVVTSGIVRDKHDILVAKEVKQTEILESIEHLQDQIEYLDQKIKLHTVFEEKYNDLQSQDEELQKELNKILKLHNNFIKINNDSNEKLEIQQMDFDQFDKDLQEQSKDLKSLRQREQLKLDELLNLKTKQELDELMRLKLSSIRGMEANMRGKDHEIDTLELIQSQKDCVILELEEQAGKFKEVVKEVHYESQKNDRVEQSLIKYLNYHPTSIDIRKIGDGYYKFGTRRIYLKLDSKDQNTLLVRVAPKEYITLQMFIIENEGIEQSKMGQSR
eukprot:403334082